MKRTLLAVLIATLLASVVYGATIDGGVVTEEDANARVSITNTCTVTPGGYCGWQSANVTNKLASNQTVNFALLFPQRLKSGALYEVIANNSNTNGTWRYEDYLVDRTGALSFTTYNGSHAVYGTITVAGNTTRRFGWNYLLNDTAGRSGKFDVFLWIGSILSPVWSMVIDPYWNSTDTIGFWPINATNSYFENAGSRRDLIAVGTPTINTTSYVTGGASVNLLAAGSDYLKNDTSGGPNGNANITTVMALKPRTWTTGSYYRIFSYGGSGACGTGCFMDLAIENQGGDNCIFHMFGSSNDKDSSTFNCTAFNTTSWHQVVVSYRADNKTLTFYLNNVFVGGGALGANQSIPSNPDILFGDNNNGGQAESFIGQMDDLRLYNLVLNSTQRSNLWNNSNFNNFANGNLDNDPNPAPANVAPSVALLAPANNYAQYGNASILFNASINDTDNSTIFNASFIFHSTLTNTSTNFASNSNISFLYERLTDCIACQWYYTASDGSLTTASTNRTISIDVAPFNVSLTILNGTSRDNQSFPLFADDNLTLTNTLDASASCNLSIDNGPATPLIVAGNEFTNNFTAAFGNHTANVTCVNTNTTVLSVNQTFQVIDATPPLISISQWTNQTQQAVTAATFGINFTDNSTIVLRNLNLNGTNYTINSTGLVNISALGANSVYSYNISANDSQGNFNTSLQYVFITDATSPSLLTRTFPTEGTVNDVLALRVNVTDPNGMDTYRSISAVTIEIQQPAGGRINYSATAESADGLMRLANVTISSDGVWVVTNIYTTDHAGNTRTNTTADTITALLPGQSSPVGGGGGGGFPFSVFAQPGVVDAAAEFKADVTSIATNRYRVVRDIDDWYSTTIITTHEIARCIPDDPQQVKCQVSNKNVATISFGLLDDMNLNNVIQTKIKLTDATGEIITIPFSAGILNFGAYYRIQPKELGAFTMPFFFKIESGRAVGVRYFAFISTIGVPLLALSFWWWKRRGFK